MRLYLIIYSLPKREMINHKTDRQCCSVRFVDSLVMACRAAKGLVLEGATFIETCSWFDDEKVKAIISTAATDVPIGTAGRNLYP